VVAFRPNHPMALRCRRVGAVHHIKTGKAGRAHHVRNSTGSRHWRHMSALRIWANSRLMHRSKLYFYSITSSARASTVGGTLKAECLGDRRETPLAGTQQLDLVWPRLACQRARGDSDIRPTRMAGARPPPFLALNDASRWAGWRMPARPRRPFAQRMKSLEWSWMVCGI
jgi:hypothetical protein